jgi:hypothetical protein
VLQCPASYLAVLLDQGSVHLSYLAGSFRLLCCLGAFTGCIWPNTVSTSLQKEVAIIPPPHHQMLVNDWDPLWHSFVQTVELPIQCYTAWMPVVPWNGFISGGGTIRASYHSKYQRICHPFHDPMDTAAVHIIIHQEDNLGMPTDEPIGRVYRYSVKSSYGSIWDYHMTNALGFSCKLAYPEPICMLLGTTTSLFYV